MGDAPFIEEQEDGDEDVADIIGDVDDEEETWTGAGTRRAACRQRNAASRPLTGSLSGSVLINRVC